MSKGSKPRPEREPGSYRRGHTRTFGKKLTYEDQGRAYDPDARGHELQGMDGPPKPGTLMDVFTREDA